mmetsp:Transcript_50242/g.88472  ORF Transcript_50242/g.88472 Transcript_50242/m.88472 type:complete len:209 (+) Transcript_50242:87-713(+)
MSSRALVLRDIVAQSEDDEKDSKLLIPAGLTMVAALRKLMEDTGSLPDGLELADMQLFKKLDGEMVLLEDSMELPEDVLYYRKAPVVSSKFAATAAASRAAAAKAAKDARLGSWQARVAPRRQVGTMRPLTLRFAMSGVDFQTRVPADPDEPLTADNLRDLLLDRGLVSMAEHVQLFQESPGSRFPTQLSGDLKVTADTVLVRQEKPL